MTTYHLYTDGGARGNPGPAATGVVVLNLDGKVLKTASKYLGVGTNNMAEYSALVQGLETIAKLAGTKVGQASVVAHLDSELVVKHLSGEYKLKAVDLKPLFAKVQSLAAKFAKVKFQHVRRELNSQADALVNLRLDAHEGGAK